MHMDAGESDENIIFLAGGVHCTDVYIYTNKIKYAIRLRFRIRY